MSGVDNHRTGILAELKAQEYYIKEGQMCAYTSQQAAVKAMAHYMEIHPDKTFILRETKIQLPWGVDR